MIYSKIVKYKKVTLEESIQKSNKSKNKLIAKITSPEFFGLKYEEVKIKTVDGLKIYGWYIPNENAKKTIILCHGRFNNRIFCLKYLKIFVQAKLTDEYNIFIPDFRNSGKSDEAITGFGYFFARDLYSVILHLNEKFSLNDFSLYGFSQGAMAIACLSKMYKKKLEEKSIRLGKLILDSPVSNVTRIIKDNARINGFKLPNIFLFWPLKKFNKLLEYNLSEMRLSKLLGDYKCLILQSQKDSVTPFEFLIDEYNNLTPDMKKKVEFKSFRKGQHVRIYLQYKEEYTKVIKDFLKECL